MRAGLPSFAAFIVLAMLPAVAEASPSLDLTSPAASPYFTRNAVFDLAAVYTPSNATITLNGVAFTPSSPGNVSESVDINEGPNPFNLTVTDWLGENVSAEFTVVGDWTPPWIDLDNPPFLLTNAQSIVVSGNVSNDTTRVFANGIEATLDASFHFVVSVPLFEGPQSIEVAAIDAVLNQGSAFISVSCDLQPPYLSVAFPSDQMLVNFTTLQVTGQTSRNENVTVTVNGILAALDSMGNFSVTVALDDLFSQTENLLIVRAVDPAGNVAYLNLTVIVDTRAPSIELDLDPAVRNAIEAGQPLGITTLTLRGMTDSSDAEITIAGQVIPLNGLAFQANVVLMEGTNRIEILARDWAGNVRVLVLVVVRDTVPPELELVSPASASFLTNLTTLVVEGRVSADAVPPIWLDYVDERGVVQHLALDLLILGGGLHGFNTMIVLNSDGNLHTVEIRAADAAGNAAAVTFDYRSKVGIPFLELIGIPSLVIYPEVWINGTTESSVHVAFIDGVEVEVVDQFFSYLHHLPYDPGTYEVTVRVVDDAGNQNVRTVSVEFAPHNIPASANLTINGTQTLVAVAGPLLRFGLAPALASGMALKWSVDGVFVGTGYWADARLTLGNHSVEVVVNNGVEQRTFSFAVEAFPPAALPASLGLTLNGSASAQASAGAPTRLGLDKQLAGGLNASWLVDGVKVGTGESLEFVFAEGDHTVIIELSNGVSSERFTFDVHAEAPPSGGPPPNALGLNGTETALLGLTLAIAVGGGAAAFFVLRRRSRAP